MMLAGKDRRGLAEIVSISTLTLVIGGVLIAQLATGHDASRELMAALAGVAVLISGRGVQSAMERGASAEQRNYESAQLRETTELLRRELDELRRANADLQRSRLDEANRTLLLAAAAQTKREG